MTLPSITNNSFPGTEATIPQNGTYTAPCSDTNYTTLLWQLCNLAFSLTLVGFMTCIGSTGKNDRRCCRLVYPIEFLRNYQYRLAYMCAFIAMSGVVFRFFLNGIDTTALISIQDHTLQYFLSVLVKYLSVCLVGLLFYPLPLCIAFDNVPMNVTGLLYATNWLVITIFGIVMCPFGNPVGNSNSASNLPVALSLVALMCCFIKRLVRRLVMGKIRPVKQFEETHYYTRVRYLLTSPDVWESKEAQDGKVTKLLRNYYPKIPGFMYSTRIVCTVGLAVSCLFQSSVFYIGEFSSWILEFDKDLPFIAASFYLSCLLAFIICAVNGLFTLRNYRTNTRMLWKGDNSFTHASEGLNPPAVVLSTLKFSGYTIAFLIASYIIMQLVLMAVFIGLGFLIWSGLIWQLLRRYWLHLVSIVILFVVMQFISRCLFLKRKFEGALVLDNIRLFHIVTFFFLFLNVLLGFAGCLIRVLKTAAFGILLLGRVDLCVMARGFEGLDEGFRAYQGFLQLEVSVTHPGVITFCHLLTRSRSPNNQKTGEDGEMGDVAAATTSPHAENRRARNRWLVAYTLLRNPQLVYKTETVSIQPNESVSISDKNHVCNV